MTEIASNSALNHLDVFDRRILQIVQRDNQLTNAAIGAQVGLSESAVRKRLAALRQSGAIRADVALVRTDPDRVQIIVTITLKDVTPQAHETCKAMIDNTPEIMEAFHISGGEDFVLIMSCPSLSWYEAWSLNTLVADPQIGFFTSRVVWSRMKYETAVPL